MMWIFGNCLDFRHESAFMQGIFVRRVSAAVLDQRQTVRFNSDEWDSFFISLPERKLQKYVICIYLVAAMFSSFISYFILELTGYRNSIE